MPASLLEIIELDRGKVVLRRADGRGKPLIEVQFSDETLTYLNDACLGIAKAMIEAGIAAVANGDDSIEYFDAFPGDGDETLH